MLVREDAHGAVLWCTSLGVRQCSESALLPACGLLSASRRLSPDLLYSSSVAETYGRCIAVKYV